MAALLSVLPDATVTSEDELLPEALTRGSDTLLRRIFENSQALGRSFGAHHRVVLERADLRSIAPRLGLRCLERPVTDAGTVTTMRTSTCAAALAPEDPALCDYFREAFDGLVLGLSDGELFHRRHRSRGHGDQECLDVLFAPEQAGASAHYGEVPQDLRAALEPIRARLRLLPGIEVEFRGFSEGVLAYEILSAPAEIATDEVIRTALERRIPKLRAQNVAPRAVFA